MGRRPASTSAKRFAVSIFALIFAAACGKTGLEGLAADSGVAGTDGAPGLMDSGLADAEHADAESADVPVDTDGALEDAGLDAETLDAAIDFDAAIDLDATLPFDADLPTDAEVGPDGEVIFADAEVGPDGEVIFADAEVGPDGEIILADATPSDATPSDATPTDATPSDATPTDATPSDATATDAIPTDAAPRDATPTDASPIDAAQPDTGADAGTPAAECTTDADCGFFGHCEPVSQTCVQCLVDADCPGNQLSCDTTHGFTCRRSCTMGSCFPFGECEPATNLCVECLTNADCNNGEVCDPNALECVECASNADCALRPGENVCDTQTNECVACASNADCASPEECITTAPGGNFCAEPTNRGLCEPCETDDDCGGPADLCVGLLGPTGIFDRSCAIDCANNPAICPNGFTCESVRNGQAMQCRPSYEMQTPTCIATRNLGAACDYSMFEPDPGCGLTATQDARCVLPTPTATDGVCTVWCLDNADCASGTTCVGATPPNQNGHCL